MKSRDECPRHGIKRNYGQIPGSVKTSSGESGYSSMQHSSLDVSINEYKADVSMMSIDNENNPFEKANKTAYEIKCMLFY